MKIALVIESFHPSKGGKEKYAYTLAEELSKRGHEVHIVARHFQKSSVSRCKIMYHHLFVPRWPGSLKLLIFSWRCQRYLKKESFDVTHDLGHTVGADIYNPHDGVKHVWLERYVASYPHPLLRAWKRLLRSLSPKRQMALFLQKRQYLSPQTRRILVISPMIKQHITTYYPIISKEKITEIPNPVDLNRFSPYNRPLYRQRERNRLRLSLEDIVLLFVANNFRLKGLHPLLKALSLLRNDTSIPPIRLLVAGNDNIQKWRHIAIKHGVDSLVLFLGPTSEMERIYAASDIFVLPTFYDSASLVVLEALASGLPVITSRWNGVHTLIDVPTTGITLKRNDDPHEIATAIRFFLDADNRLKALRASPQQVKNLNIDRHMEQIQKLYKTIVKEKRHTTQPHNPPSTVL